MLPTLLIAVLAPVVVGVALLAMRHQRQPRLATDTRGIALQTVIIIVVMLTIAASVAGVLLSRAQQTTSELEAVDISVGPGRNSAACMAYTMGTNVGTNTSAPIAGVWSTANSNCTWTGTSTATNYLDIPKSHCDLVRGTHTAYVSATTAPKCVVP